MKKATLMMTLLLTWSGVAFSQNADKPPANGYFFFAPGAGTYDYGSSTATFHFGGGVEGSLYKGLGMGAELGYLTPAEDMGFGIGILSLDGSYFFRSRTSRKVVPFVNAGYSLAFRSGAASAINFGGGIQYWFHERIGMRLEFRDHVSPEYTDVHLWNFRIGLALR
jgi:hypothetical protein